MSIKEEFRCFIEKKKEEKEAVMKEKEAEMKRKQYAEENKEAKRLSKDMAVCYEETAETEMSEESDDAARDIVYGMLKKEDYDGALSLLMLIFDLAGKEDEAGIIRDLSPEFIEDHGSVMVREFVRSLGMNPFPSMKFYGRVIKDDFFSVTCKRAEAGGMPAEEE